jgi:hypothetical protein
MAVNPIDNDEHVARHVRGRLVQRDGGRVLGCFPQAFELRPATPTRQAESYLSASWLEYFAGDRIVQLRATLAEMRSYPLDIRAKDALAVANVGRIKEAGQTRDMNLRVLHEPRLPNAPAYAAIRGLRRDDAEILVLLTAAEVAETVEVASI